MKQKREDFFIGSIFHKILFAMICMVIIPLILVIVFTYDKIRSLSHEEFRNYSLETVKQVEHSISTYLNELDAVTYTIATNPIIQDAMKLPSKGLEDIKIENMRKIEEFIYNSLYFRADSLSLIISGLNNEFYSFGEYDFNYSFDFKDNQYTRALTDAGKSARYIGSHMREYSLSEKPTFSIIRRIFDSTGKRLLGHIYLDVYTETFSKLINSVVFSQDSDVLVVENKTIIYSKHAEKILSEAEGGLYKVITSDSDGGDFIDIDGTGYFFSFTTIPKTNWKIVSLHSMESYNQKAINIIRFIILIASIFLLISILIAVIISSLITRPIQNLALLMRRVEREDFNVHFTGKGRDEVAQLGVIFNAMVDRIKTLIQTVYQSQLAEKDAIIYSLQSQINPHFLYNTLQSVSDIAEMDNNPDISVMCLCLSSIFRYNIEKQHRFVRLYDEVEHIRNYFFLQKVQYKDKLHFSVEIPQELLTIKVPRFIMQPVVENAIQHGIFAQLSEGEVKITASLIADELHLVVEDNGIGIEEESLNLLLSEINKDRSCTETGMKYMALSNVNRRLILSYGQDYGLRVESQLGEGTRVTMVIPISSLNDSKIIA
jgi:two-component system sensor histidine kinase YesM